MYQALFFPLSSQRNKKAKKQIKKQKKPPDLRLLRSGFRLLGDYVDVFPRRFTAEGRLRRVTILVSGVASIATKSENRNGGEMWYERSVNVLQVLT